MSRWDEKLERLQVGVESTERRVEGLRWQVTDFQVEEAAAPGRHHVFVTLLDERGARLDGETVRFWWSTGEQLHVADKPHDEPSLNFPMFRPRPAYACQVLGKYPSDICYGLGLGNLAGSDDFANVCYYIVYQLNAITEEAPAQPEAPVLVAPAPLDPYAREIFARLLDAEAGDQTRLGKVLVAATVLTRVADPRWLNTVLEVIRQPNQFETVKAGLTQPASKEALYVVDLVLSNPQLVLELTGSPTNFHADYAEPDWAPVLVHLATTPGRTSQQLFYREPLPK